MKKLFTIYFLILSISASFAQGAQLDMEKFDAKPYHPKPQSLVKNVSSNGTRGSKKERFALSHTNFSRGVVDQSNGTLSQYYIERHKLNTNFPTDSSNSLRWIVMTFDKLSVGFSNGGVVFPFNYNVQKSWLYLDSFNFDCIYAKPNAARPDTLIFTFFDRSKQNTPLGMLDKFKPVPDSAVLKRDTMIFTTAPAKQSQLYGGNGSTFTRPLNIQLAKGNTFGILVQFYGDVSSSFIVPPIYMVKKSCEGNGTAINSYYESTSVYLNDNRPNQTPSPVDYSNVYTNQQTFLGYNVPDCGRLFIQNFPIDVYVTDSVELSCTVIPNQHPLTAFNSLQEETEKQCNGDNIELRSCIGGELNTNITYKWSSTGGAIDDKTKDIPNYTQDQLSRVVSLTVYDGADSATCSENVVSKGIKTDLGTDKDIDCGTTVTLAATSTGTSSNSTNKYAWSGALFGKTTRVVDNVDVGVYTVTVTNAFNCAATATIKLTNKGVTNVLDFDSKVNYCKDQINTLVNNSTVKTGFNFIWTFPGGSDSVNENGKLKFTTAGSVPVTLQAYDAAGCKALPVTKNVIVKVCTGISTIGEGAIMNVYPVPTKGDVNVEINGLTKDATLTITNVVGEVIESRNIKGLSSVSEMISIANNPNGVYFLKLTTGGESTVQKIVLEK